MEDGNRRAINGEDLDRAARAISAQFGVNTIYVVGSQALLVYREDIPRSLRFSVEIDAYPDPRQINKARHPYEASEEIAALFGEGSNFHSAHGYYIDGVDEHTARLPDDWKDRAISKVIQSNEDGAITVIAPDPNDLVASKIIRGFEKDIEYAAICIGADIASNQKIKQSLEKSLDGEELERAKSRVDRASHHKNNAIALSDTEISDELMAAYLKLKGRRGL